MARKRLGNDSNVQIAFVGDDATRFAFKIEGITGDDIDPTGREFEGGQYLGVIWQDSLENPPKFIMYTPNGVIKCNVSAVCVSISDYHRQNYRPVLKIYGFITNIMGAIKCWRDTEHGINLLYDGDVEKQVVNIRRLAKTSKAYNEKYHRDILKLFEEESLTSDISTKLAKVTLDEEAVEKSKADMLKTINNKKPATRTRPTRKPKFPPVCDEHDECESVGVEKE